MKSPRPIAHPPLAAGLVALVAAMAMPHAARVEEPAPPAQEQPRFRAGANLVRVDAYVMADGAAVTDLTIQDFEVLEDNVPQRVESFQLIRPRPRGPDNELREPNTVSESRQMAAEADARVFVLFMDIWHVQIEGSYRAQTPVLTLLNRVIGQDDLVGVMTPEMSARNLTLARRTVTLEGILRDNWFWGQRNRLNSIEPREEELRFCYPDSGEHAGIAEALILRRRGVKTLDAVEDLIVHLEGIREERKFVVLLSEGWILPRPDQNLARVVRQPGTSGSPQPPPPVTVGTTPQGRMSTDPDRSGVGWGSCERERSMLAYTDLDQQFRTLLQRANRANVSFYPLDARGLVVFDEPIGPRQPPPPSVDAAGLRARHETLRELAVNTDGVAIVDTNNVERGLTRMVQDTGAYYLLGYYSTNTKLDGRYRRLTVRVKRPGADVRARPGYLAPTEAEMASARVDGLMNGSPPGFSTFPPGFARALERLTPARGTLPVRVAAAAGARTIWVTTELDASTLKAPEWQEGGQARVRFEHERGGTPPFEAEATIEPGQRAFNVTPPAGVALAAGRYVVRVQLTPKGQSVPVQATVDVTVPEEGSLLSDSGLTSRRGPSTGLTYVPTADARFRRTERVRLEIPRIADGGIASARLLGRDGQPLPVPVTVSERMDDAQQLRFLVADLTLAPLAPGEYVMEVTLEREGKSEGVAYGFRIVP
jgi:VWFA-related protein